MILDSRNISDFNKSFIDLTIRSKSWLKCDFCNAEFLRLKKTIQRSDNTKHACPNCTQKLIEETNLKKYGNKNIFVAEAIIKKTEETNLKKYGNKNYLASQFGKIKRKNSLLKKYGVESPLQNKEINLKQRQTCKELYGVENPAQSSEIMRKRSEDHPVTIESIEKRKQTSLLKFGKTDYIKTKEYWDERKKVCIEKYGVEHPHQSLEIRKKFNKTNLERYGVENYSCCDEAKEKYKNTCIERYGVPSTLCMQKNRIFGKKQNEITNWIQEKTGLKFNSDYSILEGKEIDIYNEEKKFGIEFCGLHWHNEMSSKSMNKNYHYNKFIKCKNKGIRLLTIFEDEWREKEIQCKNFILSALNIYSKRIYARNCEINILQKSEFDDFCEKTHIMGPNKHGIIHYGLKYENNIIGAMSLGYHPRNKKIVLDRLSFSSNIQIIGGASRLLSHCIEWAKNKNINEITSWSDNRWSIGKVYESMGFVLDEELPPDYCYVNIKKPYYRISKQSQKKSLTDCPTDKTEKQWALEHGLARVWDCGKKRWKLMI